MPDYASILRRSVSALPDPSPEMREAVYQRARAALARQLTAVDPPLSTREIEAQHQELEDAVVRLESEFVPQEQEQPVEAFANGDTNDEFLYVPASPTAAEPTPAPAMAAADEPPEYEDEREDFEDDDDRPSRLPVLIAVAAVVLVVIGAGAYLYAERATLFGSGDSQATPVAAATDTTQPAAPAEPDKRPDRLVNGTDAPLAEAPLPEAAADTAAVEPATPLPEPTPAPIATPESPPTLAETEPPATAAPLDTGLSDPATTQEPGTSLVEQRAIYYYQGSEGQAGQASEGTATWAEITKDERPAIQGTLHIPARNVTVTVTIYKNYDSSLPASHLVEVQFAGKLADSSIQRVPALVLKQTEQARGQPLAGAAVPVTNELFWIALSNDEDEVVRNVQLLRDGSWFDIPILFNDQTRALVTFEKGIPGDKVFETVMAGWTPS